MNQVLVSVLDVVVLVTLCILAPTVMLFVFYVCFLRPVLRLLFPVRLCVRLADGTKLAYSGSKNIKFLSAGMEVSAFFVTGLHGRAAEISYRYKVAFGDGSKAVENRYTILYPCFERPVPVPILSNLCASHDFEVMQVFLRVDGDEICSLTMHAPSFNVRAVFDGQDEICFTNDKLCVTPERYLEGFIVKGAQGSNVSLRVTHSSDYETEPIATATHIELEGGAVYIPLQVPFKLTEAIDVVRAAFMVKKKDICVMTLYPSTSCSCDHAA